MDLFSTVHLFDVRAYIFALFTLMSGAGLGVTIDDVPDVIKSMFNSKIFKALVLLMLVLQSGQPLVVSVISVMVFLLVIHLINVYEEYRRQMNTRSEEGNV